MPLREICRREVVTVKPDTDVSEAAQIMRERHVGDLIVVMGRGTNLKPVGVLTDRDIVALVVAKGIDPKTVNVEDVMMRHPVTAREDMGIGELIAQMRERGVRRVPVVDHQGRLSGIISADDLYDLLVRELLGLVNITQQQLENERSGVSLTSIRFTTYETGEAI